MKRIVLMCSEGASTSMLMKRMKQAAEAEGYECEIVARPINEVARYADADVILLGPQVRFQAATVREEVSCPVDAIDMMNYGSMNGAAVLKQARSLMGE